jgi:hypothetical protein
MYVLLLPAGREPAPALGQILVVHEQARELARTRTNVCTNVLAIVIDVVEPGGCLDEIKIVTELLCIFG